MSNEPKNSKQLDINETEQKFQLTTHQGSSPTVRCYLYENGKQFIDSSNVYSASFAYGEDWENSTSLVQIAGNVSSTENYVDFSFEPEDLAQAGEYFCQVQLSDEDNNKRYVFKDGHLNVLKSPISGSSTELILTGVINWDIITSIGTLPWSEATNAAYTATWGQITGNVSSQTDLYDIFLTDSNASSTYLTQSNASSTYETITNVNTHTSNSSIHYLTSEISHTDIQDIGNNSHAQIDTALIRLADTSNTNTGDQDLSDYLTESNASSEYLTQSNASSTYETISNVLTHTSNSSIHYLTSEIDHVDIQSIGNNSHSQIDTALLNSAVHQANASIHFIEGEIDHTNILNIGSNSHAQIDTHMEDTTIHFIEADIDHANILNIGSNSHSQIDTHMGDATVHFIESDIDHTAIQNIGSNSHAQIDTALLDSSIHQSNASIHFIEGDIDHANIQNLDYGSSGHTGFLSNANAETIYLKLDCSNDPLTGELVTNEDIKIQVDSKKLYFGAADDYSIEWDGSDAVHTISAGDFVFTGGDVGIGTATVKTKLHIKAGTNEDIQFLLDGRSGYSTSIELTEARTGVFGTAGWTGFRIFGDGANNKLQIQSAFGTGVSHDFLNFYRNTGHSSFMAGNVGIGIATPLALLDILTADTGFLRAMKLGPPTLTDDRGSYIEFSSSSVDGYGAQIGGIREGASGINALIFRTGGNTQAERMRITNAGDIKIPADSKKLYFGAGDDYSIEWNGSDAVHTISAGDFVFSGGNVGIGTTSPDKKLEVNGNFKLSNDGAKIYLGAGDDYSISRAGGDAVHTLVTGDFRFSDGKLINSSPVGSLNGGFWLGDGDTGFYESADDQLRIVTAGTSKITILTGGNVGIGTTSPDEKLEVNGNIKLTADNQKLYLGAGDDSSITDTGALMTIDPDANSAGSRYLLIDGQALMADKLLFTQTDGNEYIDSIDNYMTYGATLGHNFNAPITIASKALLGTQVAGTLEFYGNKMYVTNKSVQKVIDRTSDVQLTTVTVANEAAETEIWHSAQPANSLVAGNLMKFHADGILSTGSTNQDFVLRVRLGAIDGPILISLTVTSKKLDDDHWHMDANATQRTITVGETDGSRAYHVHLEVDGDDEQVETGVVDVDTEATMDLYLTIDWDTASVDNSISLYQAYMEYKN